MDCGRNNDTDKSSFPMLRCMSSVGKEGEAQELCNWITFVKN